MYVPPAFAENDTAVAFEVIEQHGFATLVTIYDGAPFATHLPLLLDRAGGRLLGHVARANPQWQHFATGPVLAIFHGPHAYVSPTWYQPAPDQVPTWNYVAVHVRGRAQVLPPGPETVNVVERLSAQYEPDGTYVVDPSADGIQRLARAIVAFTIEIDEVITKLKLSQNRSPEDRAAVQQRLAAGADPDGRNVAAWMKRRGLR